MERRLKAKPSTAPSYQVAERFAELIKNGKLKPGEWLPSTRTLADELGVNREIFRYAYEILKNEGLIEVVPPFGTRVTGKKKEKKRVKRGDAPLADAVELTLIESNLGTGRRPRTVTTAKARTKKKSAAKKPSKKGRATKKPSKKRPAPKSKK